MKVAAPEQTQWYVDAFEAFEKTLNGESKTPLHAIRRSAIGHFASVGFPTTRNEEWRFTSVTPIARERFQLPADAGAAPSQAELGRVLIPGFDAIRLVFVDGRYQPSLSSAPAPTAAIVVGSLAEALRTYPDKVLAHLAKQAQAESDPFTALNTGFLQDGAFISIADGTTADRPIYVLFLSSASGTLQASHPRNLFLVGKGAKVSIVEHYSSLAQGVYFTNAVTEMLLAEDASAELTRVQHESLSAFHIGTTHLRQQARSTVVCTAIALGGALVRNNVTAVLDAEGIECTLNGLSLTNGLQHVDNHTTIDHARPRCNSHELYKAILAGKSKGVFNGKIFVRKDAQKTDAKQTNKTLLLSDAATMNTKPQLEIFADDVKCTHGATVGYLDAEALFYIRSRGIGESEARDMLTFAFAGDVTGRIGIGAVRDHLNHLLHERLEQGRGPVKP
jgi:Fe-S cluster assembly protein SufD